MWRWLAITPQELCGEVTLFCGQTFRWRVVGESHWRGVIDDCVLDLHQDATGLRYQPLIGELAESRLREYFQLEVPLVPLYQRWTLVDEHFAQVARALPGVRTIRSDPIECLFSFLCSSANHIARITRMVDALCRRYGDLLGVVEGVPYHRFPTLCQLSRVQEEELYHLGFGYRARIIVQASRELKRRGGEWLYALRELPYPEAHAALVSLPGVGHKIADCVCLFALDKPQAIPVDTHVWQIAQRHYLPDLQGRSLTERTYWQVGEFFRQLFGEYAGWAHNVLFAAELPAFRRRLTRSGE